MSYHRDLDALASEQRLIAKTKQKIGFPFLCGREGDVARRCGLNKVIGNNQLNPDKTTAGPKTLARSRQVRPLLSR
jgi:hypothetical protein